MGAVPMGGSISAILLNTPGSAPNAATCLDGYPLAQQGKAGLAIGAAASANAIGGDRDDQLLAVLPIARQLVLASGRRVLSPVDPRPRHGGERQSARRIIRGLVAAGLGLMISMIGYDR